jgi:hypothetical protein
LLEFVDGVVSAWDPPFLRSMGSYLPAHMGCMAHYTIVFFNANCLVALFALHQQFNARLGPSSSDAANISVTNV